MKNILLIYRGQVFDTEIKPRLDEYKNNNIVLVVENKLTRKIVGYITKGYEQKIKIITIEEFLEKGVVDNMKFDVVVGNYPYEKPVGESKTESIWHLFAKKVFEHWKKDGYLSVIHPSAWRNAKSKFDDIKELYLSKKIISLDLNDFEKGKKVFNAGTNYDIITLINTPYESGFKTKIIDSLDQEHFMELKGMNFIPNAKFDEILSLVATNDDERLDLLFDRTSYGNDKPNMSLTKDDTFKYPCVYTITQRNGINLFYSNEKKGHFGIPKVIWSNGAGTYPIVDKDGEYGISNFCGAIIDSVENLENIKKALESEKFLNLMKFVQFRSGLYDYRVIGSFRKDFWKEFV